MIIRVKNNIESSHGCSWNVTEDYYIYIWYARTRIAHMHTQHHACYHQKGYAAILHPASCCSGKPTGSRSTLLSPPLSTKIFFEKKPTFPTPGKEKVSKIWLFRVKDRVLDSSPLRLILHHQPRFCRIKAPFRMEWCRMREDKEPLSLGRFYKLVFKGRLCSCFTS